MTDMNDRMFNVIAVSIRAQQEWPIPSLLCKHAEYRKNALWIVFALSH